MTVEAEKHMDGGIDALFSLTLLMRDTVPHTTIDYFFLECLLRLMECWTSGRQCRQRQSSPSTYSDLTPRVSQIHLNY
jgi:hypothetical protein